MLNAEQDNDTRNRAEKLRWYLRIDGLFFMLRRSWHVLLGSAIFIALTILMYGEQFQETTILRVQVVSLLPPAELSEIEFRASSLIVELDDGRQLITGNQVRHGYRKHHFACVKALEGKITGRTKYRFVGYESDGLCPNEYSDD